MSANEIRMNDRTTFRDTITDDGTAVDISSASLQQMHFFKPSWRNPRTNEEFPPEVAKMTTTNTSGGTNGIHEYTAAAAFLDRPGTWRRQSKVTISSKDWYTDIVEFEVHENLEDIPGVMETTG